MTTVLQQFAVLGAIIGAAAYIPIYFVRRRKLKAGCKHCPALKDLERKTANADKIS